MERNLALELVRVTEAAALAAARWMGKGDSNAAVKDASNAMINAFKAVKISGHVVIGERQADALLPQGTEVGSGGPPEVDIALTPLESRNAVALGRENSISIIALGNRGVFFNSPVPYMNKIAVGPIAAGRININADPLENLVNIADAKRCYVEDLTVCILDRARHIDLINKVRTAGARIELIQAGDIAGAIASAIEDSGIDVLMGIGGSDEGVLAAVGLKAMGGDFQGQLVLRDDKEAQQFKKAGFSNKGKVFKIEDLAMGPNMMFAATGVTKSGILKGVQFRENGAVTHSVVMRSKSGTIRFIRSNHFFDKEPDYS